MIEFFNRSVVTFYIYRVGWAYPARNLFYRSRSTKIFNYTWTPPRPVRSVGPTGQTGQPRADQAPIPDRSDRLVRPVDVNFGCQRYDDSTPTRPAGLRRSARGPTQLSSSAGFAVGLRVCARFTGGAPALACARAHPIFSPACQHAGAQHSWKLTVTVSLHRFPDERTDSRAGGRSSTTDHRGRWTPRQERISNSLPIWPD